MIYLESSNTNPSFNLALEQYAFETLAGDDDIFMLWQNDNAVIIGLHQNTAEEINSSFINENNISVIRRLSGGGAVFHDLGNLNYSFISKVQAIEAVDFAQQSERIAQALISLGLRVEFSGRNDMTIDGRKFSGGAAYCRDGKLLYHGTLLFNTDLEKMSEALRVNSDKLVSKSVKSIRARVVNLSDYLDIDIDEFKARIRKAIAGDAAEYALGTAESATVEAISRERYGTWEWNFGRNPEYDVIKRKRIEGFGSLRITMSVEHGKIAGFSTDGDYFGNKKCGDVAAALHGVRLELADVTEAMGALKFEEFYEGIDVETFARLVVE